MCCVSRSLKSSKFDFEGPDDIVDIDLDDANIDGKQRECPRFANNGCFKGKSTVPAGSIYEGAFPNAFNKGCSMFDLGESPVTCALLQDEVNTCKHHCTTSNCNEGDMQATKSEITCQVCQQEVDHVGTPLSGDQGCYNMTEDYSQPCPEGFGFCQTKLYVDWFAAGYQNIIFQRSCERFEATEENQCYEGGNAVDEPLFKDCKVTCNTDNCNEENEPVEVCLLI